MEIRKVRLITRSFPTAIQYLIERGNRTPLNYYNVRTTIRKLLNNKFDYDCSMDKQLQDVIADFEQLDFSSMSTREKCDILLNSYKEVSDERDLNILIRKKQ
jgi:hypothetical protein